MYLSDLKLGQKAIVLESPHSLPVKLYEMGCMPGEEIELNYAAPFSGPMCFLVQGTLISMRKELAQLVPITDPDVISLRND
mgnify:CR=1 FL=1|tara:strand:+ start:1331 stop:1573 length:243 start_codon:yes stop_codon:yes gene_type:complete